MSKFRFIAMVLLVCTVLSVILCSVRGSAMPVCDTRDGSSLIAESFVKNDATFKFDGMADSLSIRVEHANALGDPITSRLSGLAIAIASPLGPKEYTFKAKFDSLHSGYGDRTGKYLAQVITPHEAEITIVNCQVKSAVMDGQWDMVSGKLID